MDVLIRADEACQPDPFLLWDSLYDPVTGVADWALAGNQPLNSGGLAANAALETATVLCLFTDAQLPATHPLAAYVADGDFRGWWGDGIDVRTDLGEGPLGSFLWVLQRTPLNAQTPMWAQTLALAALAPLQTQGVVVRIDAQAEILGTDMLALSIQMYGRDGGKVYDRNFDLIWNQISTAS